VHLTGAAATAPTAVAAATAVATTAATTTVGGLAGLAAGGATGRSVGESAGGVKLLLTSGPKEIHAAIAAPKGLIDRHAPRPLSFSGDV
jgi:hypothetical protein